MSDNKHVDNINRKYVDPEVDNYYNEISKEFDSIDNPFQLIGSIVLILFIVIIFVLNTNYLSFNR